MDYLTVKKKKKKWGISDRRVRILCSEGKIFYVIRKGRSYQITEDAVKPVDGRSYRYKTIPDRFSEQFLHIDSLKEEISRYRPLTQGELERLREEFLIEYTYNSNAIEGNTLTLQETALVLEGVTIDKKPLKDHLEAVGHKDAFLFVEKLARDLSPLTEHDIKQIHTLVLADRPEDRGLYRRIPVRISGAYHQPPEPVQIPGLIEKLLQEFSDNQMHPIERAALFHLKFEGIHPFVDGNGRTGRLIMNLSLMQEGYLPIDIKYTDRKRYYDAFDSYYRDGSSDEMTELVTGYIEERQERMLSILSGRY